MTAEHVSDPAWLLATLVAAGARVATVHADYVRHKPDDTTIVGFVATTVDGGLGRGYVRWCGDERVAAALAAKASTMRPRRGQLGVGLARTDPHTVVRDLPNDGRLRRLRWYLDPHKLKRSLSAVAAGAGLSGSRSTVEVVRYKPERRAVLDVRLVGRDRLDGARVARRVFVRVLADPVAGLVAGRAEALATVGVAVPRPVAVLDGGHVSVDAFVDGVELRSALATGWHDPDGLVDDLLRLHGAGVDAPPRTVAAELAHAAAGLDGLGRWSGRHAELAVEAKAALVAAAPSSVGPDVTLHGDLHDKNVLVGDRYTFIDLDRLSRGPAAADLGRLRSVVHGRAVRARHDVMASGGRSDAVGTADAVDAVDDARARDAIDTVERVVDGYRRVATVGDHELSWFTAVGMIDQALLAVRHVEPNWRESAAELLGVAIDMVAARVRR